MIRAIVGGVAAGIVATLAEIALWWFHGDPLPATLYRDTRFAAAIVMGQGVLPPPATFDIEVALVATAVHFALSIAYAVVLGALIAQRAPMAAIAIGALFGIALYAVNMHAFTALFPWFAATRDGITLASHVVFGITLAAIYRACS